MSGFAPALSGLKADFFNAGVADDLARLQQALDAFAFEMRQDLVEEGEPELVAPRTRRAALPIPGGDLLLDQDGAPSAARFRAWMAAWSRGPRLWVITVERGGVRD